jgi:hypothetical protein
MKIGRFLALCIGVLFVLPADSQTSPLLDLKRTEDVCEAALRYLFAHDGPEGAKAICISATASLPLHFIDRFAGNNPPVVWSTECTRDQWAGTKYLKTSQPAVLIKITSIRWISSKEAQVKGGSVTGDFLRPPITISIVERDGRWLVKQDKDTGVS